MPYGGRRQGIFDDCGWSGSGESDLGGMGLRLGTCVRAHEAPGSGAPRPTGADSGTRDIHGRGGRARFSLASASPARGTLSPFVPWPRLPTLWAWKVSARFDRSGPGRQVHGASGGGFPARAGPIPQAPCRRGVHADRPGLGRFAIGPLEASVTGGPGSCRRASRGRRSNAALMRQLVGGGRLLERSVGGPGRGQHGSGGPCPALSSSGQRPGLIWCRHPRNTKGTPSRRRRANPSHGAHIRDRLALPA